VAVVDNTAVVDDADRLARRRTERAEMAAAAPPAAPPCRCETCVSWDCDHACHEADG
jgi:hypothetical protein